MQTFHYESWTSKPHNRAMYNWPTILDTICPDYIGSERASLHSTPPRPPSSIVGPNTEEGENGRMVSWQFTAQNARTWKIVNRGSACGYTSEIVRIHLSELWRAAGGTPRASEWTARPERAGASSWRRRRFSLLWARAPRGRPAQLGGGTGSGRQRQARQLRENVILVTSGVFVTAWASDGGSGASLEAEHAHFFVQRGNEVHRTGGDRWSKDSWILDFQKLVRKSPEKKKTKKQRSTGERRKVWYCFRSNIYMWPSWWKGGIRK